jgi:hypothetical protein
MVARWPPAGVCLRARWQRRNLYHERRQQPADAANARSAKRHLASLVARRPINRVCIRPHACRARPPALDLYHGHRWWPANAADRYSKQHPGDSTPAWSPDGHQIAFASQREGTGAIYVINADGSQAHRVTPLSISCSNPVWIENGQRLAFFLPTFGYPNIAKIGLDGNQMQLVTPNFDTNVPFSWSSDGTRSERSSRWR